MTDHTIEYRGSRVTLSQYVTERAREAGRWDQESLADFAQDFGDVWAAEGEAACRMWV